MADDSKDGSEKDRNAPTVRDLKGPSPVFNDTIPEMVGQYVPPRPLPGVSRHRTIDIKPVRLSDEADPRRWRTQRRLVTPEERPAKSQTAFWLAGGAVTLLALGVWALVRAPALPVKTTPPVTAPPPAQAAVGPTASARAKDRSETPNPPAAPAVSRNAASQPNPDAPKAEPTAPKATRPREGTKKRKDPWLE